MAAESHSTLTAVLVDRGMVSEADMLRTQGNYTVWPL